MIRKHADPRPLNTAIEKAGWNAEKQMAHYLDRAFKDRKDVHVFHDLRIEDKGEVAQIDHLVLDIFGFHIIESKSVTSSVRVNARDEWMREWDGTWKGIPSPLLQAQRQSEFLHKFLDDHAQHLGKMVIPLFKFHYGILKWFHWVAISDQGVIDQRVEPPHQNLLKADQVPVAIQEEFEQSMKDSKLFPNAIKVVGHEPPSKMPESLLDRISLWILNHHSPVGREDVRHPVDPARLESFEPDPKYPAHANELPESKVCRFCHTKNLKIVRGTYGLYFKCLDCGKNTPIIFTCTPRCKPELQARDDGLFVRVCPQCNTEKAYFRNPPP